MKLEPAGKQSHQTVRWIALVAGSLFCGASVDANFITEVNIRIQCGFMPTNHFGVSAMWNIAL